MKKIFYDDFQTSTKNLARKRENNIRLQPPFVPFG